MMRNSMGRLLIQADWNTALRNDGEKIWVSYRKVGSPTVHGEIKVATSSSSGEATYQCSDGFSIESIESRRIVVKYAKDGEYAVTAFEAAAVSFSSIHPSKKSVLSLDVGSGGLGVSSDSAESLVVWETETGEIRRRLQGHFGDVYACRLFPSGVVVLSGGADMRIKIWSAETGQCAATCLGHKAPITDFSIVDRGRNVFSTSKDGTAKLWDCGTQQCLLTFDDLAMGTVNQCDLAPVGDLINLGNAVPNRSEKEVGTDGKILALAGENGKLASFSIQSRAEIFKVDCQSPVNCCLFLDPTQLVCGTEEGHLHFWDVRQTNNPLKIVSDRNTSPVLSLARSPNGLLASMSDGSVVNVKNNYQIGMEYTGVDCDPVFRIATDDKFIYTACRDGIIRKYIA